MNNIIIEKDTSKSIRGRLNRNIGPRVPPDIIKRENKIHGGITRMPHLEMLL